MQEDIQECGLMQIAGFFGDESSARRSYRSYSPPPSPPKALDVAVAKVRTLIYVEMFEWTF